MPPSTLRPGYLDYLHGEAADLLEGAFKAEEMPHGLAYRTALKDAVNTYCTLFDRAAQLVARFVETLPYEGSFQHSDALLGLRILQETREALDELLAQDAELRGSVVGEVRTDGATDRDIRKGSREFDIHHELDEKERLPPPPRRADAARDEGVRSSFYDGADAEKVDETVGRSSRDALDGCGKVGVYSFDTPPEQSEIPKQGESASVAAEPSGETPSATPAVTGPEAASQSSSKPPPKGSAAMRLFGERPSFIEIEVPDFKGQDPIIVFRQASEWMMEQIIAVASGSHKKDSFPRIAPIIDLEGEEHATAVPVLMDLVAEIRKKVKKLRPPMGDGTDQLRDLIDRMKTFDPKDSHGLHDMLDEMEGLFGTGREDKNPWGRPWEEGGWRDEDDS